MSTAYAREKFLGALMALAVGNEVLPIRLRNAYVYNIIHVSPEDMPTPKLRTKVKGIKEDLSWIEAKGEEGKATATARIMDYEEASAIAHRIIDTYFELKELKDAGK